MTDKPLEYYAYQLIPEDFAKQADLVRSLVVSRVEYLLDRVVADGRNPLEGDLTVVSAHDVNSQQPRLRFIWAMHE